MIHGLDNDMELPQPDRETEDAIRAAAKEPPLTGCVQEPCSPRSLDACPDEDFNCDAKTEIARLQLTDHLAGREIACAKCRLVRPMHAYYRCRWCGVWYCLTCAGVHFGPDEKHFQANSSDMTLPRKSET